MAEYSEKEALIKVIQEDYNIRMQEMYKEEIFQGYYSKVYCDGVEDEFKSVIKIIENMPSVGRWISVKDRLPDEDDCYLVVIESEICVSIDIAEYSENRWHKHDKVLYWQPLPEPPKDGETNG